MRRIVQHFRYSIPVSTNMVNEVEVVTIYSIRDGDKNVEFKKNTVRWMSQFLEFFGFKSENSSLTIKKLKLVPQFIHV